MITKEEILRRLEALEERDIQFFEAYQNGDWFLVKLVLPPFTHVETETLGINVSDGIGVGEVIGG